MASKEIHTYSYFRASKTEDLLAAAHQYKKLRLEALQLSPSSFASNYEVESQFTDDYWVSRLTQDGAVTFICTASRIAENDISNDIEPKWVAQVTFLGPQAEQDFTIPIDTRNFPVITSTSEKQERWQMLGLFTHPSHRGKGIAKTLTRNALDYLTTRQDRTRDIIVRLMVKPGMHATIKMYQQLGFVEVGYCSLANALIGNGDRQNLPEGYENLDKYTACTSHVMMQHFSS
ncbi:uncharacterized protein N7511_001570 [Penicillium nucicola]|uniref:uncharacterized protein n=1 Tax=Penicillium nucicola TaxID=1850975 RepID=UPI002545AB81|nr:uncharacterized protein N7511_001570 [Penicillium nucicola]KAJ5776559.1 hypothetical protein N7511_001570 [Penicillium nucicola]